SLSSLFILIFYGQLPTSCINVFSTAPPNIRNDPLTLEVVGEYIYLVSFGIQEVSQCNWVVFNEVYFTWYMLTEFGKFFCIFQFIIEIVEHNILKCNWALCLRIEVFQRFR